MYLFMLILLFSFCAISCRAVGAQYRTATACENSVLEIVCEKDTHINLIRANFGRFSIQTCNEHGSHEMKVDCVSPISFRVMEESCGMKQSCVIPANSGHFGDPCPETPKYLEAHYQCLPDNQKKRYRWQSTTSRSKLPGKPLSSPSTSLPSSSSFSSTTTSTLPSVTQTSGLSFASLKPEVNHVHPNTSKDEISMKNGLTHPNSGYSVAAGTSTHINASRLDDYDTSLSIAKSGSNKLISLKVNPIERNFVSTSLPSSTPIKPTVFPSTPSSTIGYNKLSSPITPNLETSSPTIAPIKASSSLSERASTTSVKVAANDFDDRPIYIRHPHPGSPSESESEIVSDTSSDYSVARSKSDLPSPYPSHRKSTTGSSESDYINIYESLPSSSSSSLSSTSSNSDNVKLDKVSPTEYGSPSIFIRHPHPGVNRESSSTMVPPSTSPSTASSYDEQWMKSDSGSEMINEKSNQLSTNSWLSGNLSSNNLVTGIVFALGAALSALGLFFYLYIRDSNIKNRFLSLASALNGKIICSRNIAPMEPGASLKDDVSSLRKRGGHLISVTPTSKYMASENAAHYIRDPIIGPGSGSTLNVIAPLGVKYLLPSTTNSSSSVKDLTYGCSQLMNTLTVNNSSLTAPSAASNQHHHQQQQQQIQQQIHHHRLSSPNQGILGVTLHPTHHMRPTATGLPLPIGLVVEHVYECIDDDPYTAKLFMPVDCESNKYQRRDNSIYNGGDFMLPINNHHINHHQQQQQQSTDLTSTLQALPAIVQENVSLRSSGLGVSLNAPSGLSQSTPSSSSHPHYQLNFACYPCQSQVVNYINKDRIDQQLRENLSLVNPNDQRRPEIV
ncbi:A-agglutinin anchorage subunit [Tetranychus urticae]|uniref:SUEL-type lectin domain-containing protein n=1 Tax=Tetranychus urticae TaxID=32264 RepID=T1JWP3_TETUR|nr:A-agglutinin anchorage subunit [Tetranychus urticae]